MEADESLNIGYQKSDNQALLSGHLGYAMRILASSSRRNGSMAEACLHLWPAIQLQQIDFLYNSKSSPSLTPSGLISVMVYPTRWLPTSTITWT